MAKAKKALDGRLTAMMSLTGGDGLWHPCLELSQGFATYDEAVAFAERAIKDGIRHLEFAPDRRKTKMRRNTRAAETVNADRSERK